MYSFVVKERKVESYLEKRREVEVFEGVVKREKRDSYEKKSKRAGELLVVVRCNPRAVNVSSLLGFFFLFLSWFI